MFIRTGLFSDDCRGNGWHISTRSWTFAVRRRWRIYFVRPPGKPCYSRLYVGPFEIERRLMDGLGLNIESKKKMEAWISSIVKFSAIFSTHKENK